MSNTQARRKRLESGRVVSMLNRPSSTLYQTNEEETDGAGIFSALSKIGSKVASKAASKASKELIKKTLKTAAEKALESGSKKLGDKVGNTVAEKIGNVIENKINPKDTSINPTVVKAKLENFEAKGEEIKKMLDATQHKQSKESSPPTIQQMKDLSPQSIRSKFDLLLL